MSGEIVQDPPPPMLDNDIPTTDPNLHIPSDKYFGLEISEAARIKIGVVGLVFSIYFHILTFFFINRKMHPLLYCFSELYAIGMTFAVILLVTTRDHIIDVLRNDRKTQTLGLICIGIDVVIIFLATVSSLAKVLVILRIILMQMLYVLYSRISPFILNIYQSLLARLKLSKKIPVNPINDK